jgi:hypothetical protein
MDETAQHPGRALLFLSIVPFIPAHAVWCMWLVGFSGHKQVDDGGDWRTRYHVFIVTMGCVIQDTVARWGP